MMFAGISGILLVWSWMALRDRPLRHYALIYVATAAMGCAVECATLGIWYPFETHVFVFPDPYRDLLLTEIIVKLFLFPLIGCLYVRYAGDHPVRTAAIGAGLLGLLELFLVRTGAMIYFRWSAIITVLLFLGLFLILHLVIHMPIPLWLDAGATAYVAGYITTQFFSGVLLLWQYRLPLPFHTTDALFLIVKNMLVVGPSALAVALVPQLRNPAGISLAVGLNLLVEELMRAAGVLVHTGWNPWLSALRYLAIILITMAYAKWQGEVRTGPIVLARSHPVRVR